MILVIVLVGLILIVDLYTFELIVQDPGYYVVARRSDRPSDVIDAIEKIRSKDLPRKKLLRLKRRYKRKTTNKSIAASDRELWKKALKDTLKLLSKTKQ